MPSFILRDLNPELWSKVQAKAAAEGTTVKAVILRLLTTWSAALIVLSVVACGYENPIAPTLPELPTAGVPSRIELSANPGTGADAGSGVINVRVFDALAAALSAQTVTVTASEGALSAPSVVTDDKGAGRLTITGPAGAAITITATSGVATQKTQIAMQARPDEAPPLVPPTFPPPSPPPPPPPPPVPTAPSFTITVSASPSSLVVNGSSTLTASVVLNAGATSPTGYAWDCDANGSFETPTAANAKACTYTASGTIQSAVRVTGANASGTGSVDVTVAAAAALAVSVSASSATPPIGTPVTFTASLTSFGPVPASGLDWEWDSDGVDGTDFFSPSHVSTDVRTVTYSAAGVKTIKAKVTDTATGRTATGTTTITVAAPPASLHVTITPPASITVGTSATFTGTASSTSPIPSTTALTWEWDDEGDGFDVTSTGHAVTDSHSHTYNAAGPRTVRVRVTDPATGQSATDSLQITVP